MRKLLIFFTLFIIVSCSSKEGLKIFTDGVDIYGTDTGLELLTEGKFNGVNCDYGYIGVGLLNKEVVHLLDSNSLNIIASAGTLGNGPKEILNPPGVFSDFCKESNTLYVAHPIKNTIIAFSLEQLEGTTTITPKEEYNIKRPRLSFLSFMNVINDSTFVLGVDCITEFNIYLVDKHNNYVDSVKFNILNNPQIDYTGLKLNLKSSLSPDKSTLIVNDTKYNALSKYSIKENSIKYVDGSVYYDCGYQIKENKIVKIDNPISNYGTVYCLQDRILIVTTPITKEMMDESKKKAKEEGAFMVSTPKSNSVILEFDNNLNYIKSYKCDEYFRTILLTPSKDCFYAHLESRAFKKYSFK